ncbi:MAG TPA: acyl-ACP--UDP-N-acetylglucosamine O-acyltransferase [Bacteriovoracaceae bacterium]|nr:acyl-ACP--UDP-N-acetylglucosamine O-acyltransferase [Bacteriovoracaceae bacterium]
MSKNYEAHPMSFIHPEAKIGNNVKIGPFCVIGANVEIGDDCLFHSNVVVEGHTTIGKGNKFSQFASIGAPPQDTSYKGEPTLTIIGDNNTFREYVSVHRGTTKQDLKTVIGSNSLFMAYCHIAHDCSLGNNLTFANAVGLAGHVTIGDRVIIGGNTGITQFVTLGKGAYIGGGSGIDRDIPNFCTAYGNRVRLKGINIIGLKRQGFSKEVVSEVVDFYRTMEASALAPRAFISHPEFMVEYINNPVVQDIAAFIKKSEIGIAPFMAG